ncbi:GPI transamidase component PIG-T [Episyrphus balteatus]|uniref:GPI transamidase component PIG-T n=1 Tax=Episyrphus balteatus TaxID=286459 RepID=UPI00248523AB|nr:GPI transamidase component PIG-T [Episyrphus balteatus]
MFFVKILLLFYLISPSLQQNEEFHEELYVKPLASGHVNTYFQFATRWKLGAGENLHNTNFIPRAIAEILLHFDLKELHISLTQGLWRYESWGYPVVDAPPGAEAWAWFSGTNLTQSAVDSQWKDLASTFSGILCSSLNFIDKTNSVEPKYSFRPRFGSTNQEKFIRYSSLPREIVCTENLTPWKKLLPCASKNGFVSLLNSGFVHNTNFHSLGISLRTFCDEFSEGCLIELVQTANLVYDPKLLGSNDFSLRKMFGQGMNGACPLASSSKVYVDITNNKYTLTPAPNSNFTSIRGGSTVNFGVYDIQKETPNKLFNVAWVLKDKKVQVPQSLAPPIYAHRYILGHGQENGQIVTQITNTHWEPLNILLQENIPWFVPSYLHTLKVMNGETPIKPTEVHYIPGVQRERPYHLEIAFRIPAKSSVQVSFDFDYIFLKWLEYPPDANHGHYLGSAVITTLLPIGRNYTAIPIDGFLFADCFNASRSSYFLQIRTESLILSLPTPDFSMPYNVICLACTGVALAFGPIHSVATKKIVIENKDEPQTLLGKLKAKLFGKKSKDVKESDVDADGAGETDQLADMEEKEE